MLTSHTTSVASRMRTTAILLGLGAGILLTGCSASDDDGETQADESAPVEETTEAPTAEDEEPTDDADDADVADEADEADVAVGGGDSSVTVTIDGEPIDIADPTVVCHDTDGTLSIAIGSATGADGIGAILEGGEEPVVTSVALGSVDGTAMAWAEGAPGEATATKDGSNYEITGSMIAVDMDDPTSMDEKPFTMQITCP